MDRRTLLKTGSLAALGLGFGGCAARSGVEVAPSSQLVNLPPVRASWDRVIRTTVGLRPYRPSGFVLKAEKFGAKTVIHNYGHGGSGHSLAWGTGSLAADLAIEHGDRRVRRGTGVDLDSGAVAVLPEQGTVQRHTNPH